MAIKKKKVDTQWKVLDFEAEASVGPIGHSSKIQFSSLMGTFGVTAGNAVLMLSEDQVRQLRELTDTHLLNVTLDRVYGNAQKKVAKKKKKK